MSSTLRMLLWREWRERRPTLLVCLFWMLGGTIYSIAYSKTVGIAAHVASFWSTAMLFGLVAPVFVAARTALGESSDRTRAFSDGLPVAPKARGWIRLLGGSAAIVLPILLGAILYTPITASGWLEQAPLRQIGSEYVRLPSRMPVAPEIAVQYLWLATAIAGCAAVMLYLVLAIVGTWFRTESSAIFTGAAIAAVSFFTLGAATSLESAEPSAAKFIAGSLAPNALIINYGYGDAVGEYGDLQMAPQVVGPLIVNALVQGILAALFVSRYARRLGGAVTARRRRLLPRLWRWQPRLPTRTLALGWLTLRQMLPMCLPGLAIACLLAWMNERDSGFGHASFADRLAHGATVLGLIWGVVVGAGVFAPEMDKRLGEFWRVLPISFGRWFVLKYFAGLAVVLLVIDGTAVALGWNSPRFGEYDSMNWAFIMVMIPFHATIFALAAAWSCVLRRPALGGFAALATFALFNIALEWSPLTRGFDPIEVFNLIAGHRPPGISQATERLRFWVALSGMATVSITALGVAWMGLRRYEPWRSN